MTFEYLEEFCSAVKFRNITKAADHLFKSQPTLSRHLAELESELGVRLIERDNRSFRLTPAGEYFHREVLGILSELERIRGRTQQIATGTQGQLRIASFGSYVPYVFNRIQSFRQEHPEIHTSIIHADNVIAMALEPDEADIGIVFSFELPSGSDYCTRDIGHDHFCLVLANDHPLSASDSIPVQAIKGEKFLLLSQLHYPYVENLVAHLLHNDDSYPEEKNSTISVENTETMLLRARFGDGIGLLPYTIARERAANCSFVRISGEESSFRLCLCWKRSNRNPALKRFLEEFDCDFLDLSPDAQSSAAY